MTQPGILCSFEGISGVGKSYLTNALKTLMTDVPVTFVSEVVDRCGRELDRDIIGILSASGDRFFRGGRPRTETFLLLALKMFDFEARIAPLLAEGHLVIEDRSIDTIAIYQALILHPEEPEQQLRTAREIYALASCWRQPPQVTFLIEDHFDVALARVEQREKQRLTEDEVAVLRQASSLYTQYARAYPSRMVPLHRQRLSNHALLHGVREHLLTMRMCVSAENPSALLTE
jgi:dTMP kinase